MDRALKFYALASEQGSGALVDRSNDSQLEGKPMKFALSGLRNVPLQVNRMNVQAMELLSQRLNVRGKRRSLRQALASRSATHSPRITWELPRKVWEITRAR